MSLFSTKGVGLMSLPPNLKHNVDMDIDKKIKDQGQGGHGHDMGDMGNDINDLD